VLAAGLIFVFLVVALGMLVAGIGIFRRMWQLRRR
jgi:hypothetical protein